MFRILKFIICFGFVASQGSAQEKLKIIHVKKDVDTIDYKFNGSYLLTRITENGHYIDHLCGRELYFPSLTSLKYFKDAIYGVKQEKPKLTDTLSTIYWYSCRLPCFGGTSGKLTLNKAGNAIIVERFYISKEKELLRIVFKVIKFTEFEIILKDITNTPFPRLYYFNKNYLNPRKAKRDSIN